MTPALITQLESATEGSRELDAQVWRVFGYDSAPHRRMRLAMRYATASHWESIPPVTTSIDAAVALIREKLPGAEFDLCARKHPHFDEVRLYIANKDAWILTKAWTLPLAACAALLRAMEARANHPEKPDSCGEEARDG